MRQKLESLLRLEDSKLYKSHFVVSLRNMDVVSIVAVVFSLFWAASFLLGGETAVGWILLVISALFSCCYFLLRRKMPASLPKHLLIGLLLLGVSISNFYTGGLIGSNDVAFVSVAVLALFLLGSRGLLWVFICMLDIAIFIALSQADYKYPQLVSSWGQGLDSYLTLYSSLLLISFIALLYDRARKKAEKDIMEAKEQAEVASKAKSRFLASMSHELRTPLNAVIGLTDLTLKNGLPDEQRRNLKAVKSSARQLLLLVDDVLDIASVEFGNMSLRQTPFCPDELLRDLRESFMLRAEERPIEFRVNTMGVLPNNLVGDYLRIRQVASNLLDNSFKYTEQGHVQLSMKYESEMLCLEVEDTGCGIAPGIQTQIFRPFSRPDLPNARHIAGSGLGLALCKELVNLMGGQITLSSSPGEGSVFLVKIPAKLLPGPKQGQKYHLLAAEDDRIGQELLKTVLNSSQYEVCVVSNGQEAVDEMKNGSYDLVLMDIQMPYMDGLEATRVIRQMNSSKGHVPILALTAHAFEEEKKKCFDAGMDDFIAKPIEPDALLRLVGDWLCKGNPAQAKP